MKRNTQCWAPTHRGRQVVGLVVLTSLAAAGFGNGGTFPGNGVGAIPDSTEGGCGPPAGPSLDVTFAVTGISGPVADVDLAMTLTHTWVGDLNVTLFDPVGTPHVIYAHTGWNGVNSTCGDSSDLAGTYEFDDQEPNDWWAEAAARIGSETLVNQGYRTSFEGGTAAGGSLTEINLPFSGEMANGTWTLRFEDEAQGDTGSVTAAALGINLDCNTLTLSNDTVLGTESFAACDTITLGTNYVVSGTGDLTVTSGQALVFVEGFEVSVDGEFAGALDQTLNPLLAALEASRLLGEAAHPPEARLSEPGQPASTNPDKLRQLDLERQLELERQPRP